MGKAKRFFYMTLLHKTFPANDLKFPNFSHNLPTSKLYLYFLLNRWYKKVRTLDSAKQISPTVKNSKAVVKMDKISF